MIGRGVVWVWEWEWVRGRREGLTGFSLKYFSAWEARSAALFIICPMKRSVEPKDLDRYSANQTDQVPNEEL